MAAFRTGDTLVWIIGPVQDDSGTAVTGATWSAVVALRPDGTTFVPTYSEIGSGVYQATVVSTARGNWFLYSTATVNGVVYADAGSITVDDGSALASDWTSARAAKLDALGASTVTVQSPVASNQTVTIYQRTDYAAADARSLDWTTTANQWPDLTGASIVFVARPSSGDPGEGVYAAGTVITPTGAQHVRVELTAAATHNAKPGNQTYQLRATLTNGDVIPLATGQATIIGYLGQ